MMRAEVDKCVRGDGTSKRFAKGTFPAGDPSHGLEGVLGATRIENPKNVELGLFDRAGMRVPGWVRERQVVMRLTLRAFTMTYMRTSQ